MEKKKHRLTKVICMIGAILLIAAIGLFVGGMTAAGWDFSKLSTVRYVQKNYYSRESISSLKIKYANAKIRVVYEDIEQSIHISYPVRVDQNDEEIATVDFAYSEEDGSLTVTEKIEKHFDLFNWDLSAPVLTVTLPSGSICAFDFTAQSGSIGFESAAPIQLNTLTLRSSNGDISATSEGGISVSGDVLLHADNGHITAENLTVGGSLHTESDNGSISLSSVSANAVIAKTDNGDVRSANVTAASKFSAETDNGNIAFTKNLQANEIVCITDNGNVTGETNCLLTAQSLSFTLDNGDLRIQGALAGKPEDYTVLLNLKNGSTNISSGGSGNKTLSATVQNGHIRVQFQN